MCPTIILGDFNIDFGKGVEEYKDLETLRFRMSQY